MLFKCGLCSKEFQRKCQLYNHLNRKTSCQITEIVASSIEELEQLTNKILKQTILFNECIIKPQNKQI
jgi:hypothetical protein